LSWAAWARAVEGERARFRQAVLASLDVCSEPVSEGGRRKPPAGRGSRARVPGQHLVVPDARTHPEPITKVATRSLHAERNDEEPAADSSRVRAVGDGLGVVLVDADRLGRTALSRAFLRQGMTVRVVDSIGEVLEAAAELLMVHVLVCAADGPQVAAELLELRDRLPALAVLARGTNETTTAAMLALVGPKRHAVLRARATVAEVVAKALTLARAVRDENEESA
jgi:ActR/RegA family two-component response regulator